MNQRTPNQSIDFDLAYGSSAAKIEPYGIEHIPETDRHGKPYTQFTTWLSGNLTLSLLITGFFPPTLGLSVWESLSAVVIGSLMGGLILGILSTMGVKLGVPIQIQARGPLGYIGNFLPVSFVNVFASVGWAVVNTVFAALALKELVDIPFWLGAVLLFLIVGIFSIWGYNLLHLVNKVGTVVLGLLFLVITALALRQANWSFGVNTSATGYIGEVGGWISAAGFFLAWSLAWTPFASDFARYLPVKTSPVKVAFYTELGNFLPSLWLGCTGVLVANFAGDLAPVQALAHLTGKWAPVAMVTLVLGCLPTNGLVIYGGALSVLTLGFKVTRQTATIIIVALSFFISLALQENIYTAFYDFLVLSGYFIAPYLVVILLDYFIAAKSDEVILSQIFDSSRRFEWGFFAWIAGCAMSAPFWVWARWTGPVAAKHPDWGDLSYYVGGISAMVIYLLLLKLPPINSKKKSKA